MKEGQPTAHDLANDYVNKVEDDWVKHQFCLVEAMEKRAKGSHTLIAEKEFHSAEDALSREIERLTPRKK